MRGIYFACGFLATRQSRITTVTPRSPSIKPSIIKREEGGQLTAMQTRKTKAFREPEKEKQLH